ncbi:hypothetical protein KDW46_02185 [Burkholderia vietnamiensis]|nr:hypothetical protein [Burkholderia vietnamiensis]
MTDRELLELAAKASGFSFDKYVSGSSPEDFHYGLNSGLLKIDRDRLDAVLWNPLLDDGDALRLAVKLSMQLDISASGCLVYLSNSAAPIGICAYSETRDIEAATRRAIVRAAAEIGKRGA